MQIPEMIANDRHPPSSTTHPISTNGPVIASNWYALACRNGIVTMPSRPLTVRDFMPNRLRS